MVFLIDIETTGIDCMKDHVTKICIMDLKNNKHMLKIIKPPTENFKWAMSDILNFSKDLHEDGYIYFIALNGHRFVFPILTKELRRYPIKLEHNYKFLDLLYSFRKKGISTSIDAIECTKRIQNICNIFENKFKIPLNSKEAFDMIYEDNIEIISKYPQSSFSTPHFNVNE